MFFYNDVEFFGLAAWEGNKYWSICEAWRGVWLCYNFAKRGY